MNQIEHMKKAKAVDELTLLKAKLHESRMNCQLEMELKME